MHGDEYISHPNNCIPETLHQDKGFNFIRDNIPSQFWKERQCYIVFVTSDQARASRLSSRTYPALENFPEVNVCSCVFPIGTSTFTSSQLNELRNLSGRMPRGVTMQWQAYEDDMVMILHDGIFAGGT
jgi:hypothetical protein